MSWILCGHFVHPLWAEFTKIEIFPGIFPRIHPHYLHTRGILRCLLGFWHNQRLKPVRSVISIPGSLSFGKLVKMSFAPAKSAVGLPDARPKIHSFNRPLSPGGHVESQENKRFVQCMASLAVNSHMGEA